MAERPPTIRQRRLAAELRHLRELASFNLDQASGSLGWSKAKLSRIETARIGLKAADLVRLLDLYEVPERRRESLTSLARNARQRGWWDAYADQIHTDYAAYLELESAATLLRGYSAVVLHGLLQTEEYAREVIRSALMRFSPPAEIDNRVEVRMARKAALAKREPSLRICSVIDENCLRRVVGGPTVMKAQLAHLMELAESPSVTLQVLPHGLGAHPAGAGTFSILQLPELHVPDIVYIETMTSALYIEDPSQVHIYATAFNHLRAEALSPDESLDMLAELAEAY
ncbi:helix-turn-helix domain-containing protein [Actinomadura hibisca]|uniref:helix-turn-helix domain-containing protein n=1 Tax=Actinomadura hibisca TaxID=68565 RepID=UPI000833BB1B|nr:helix-turn-helix transcriptional regulator [Actinomadura hibisca]